MQEAGLSPFHLPQTPTKYIYSIDLRNYVPVDAQALTNHILDLRSFNDVIEWEQTSDGLCTKTLQTTNHFITMVSLVLPYSF